MPCRLGHRLYKLWSPRKILFNKVILINTRIHVVNNSSPTEIQLHTSGHDLSRVLEDACQKDRYTYVTVITEGKEFKAHKVVLATQSPFFETRLEKR